MPPKIPFPGGTWHTEVSLQPTVGDNQQLFCHWHPEDWALRDWSVFGKGKQLVRDGAAHPRRHFLSEFAKGQSCSICLPTLNLLVTTAPSTDPRHSCPIPVGACAWPAWEAATCAGAKGLGWAAAVTACQGSGMGKDCTDPARVKAVPEMSHVSDFFKDRQLWAPWTCFTQQNLGSHSRHILATFSTTFPPIPFPLPAVYQRYARHHCNLEQGKRGQN